MNSIKVLSYADLHIGVPMVDAWKTPEKIIDIAIKQKVTHIVSTGDDFDKEITTTAQRATFAEQVKRAIDHGIHFGIIPGNHSRQAEMLCYQAGATVWTTPGWYSWYGLSIGALPHMKYSTLSGTPVSYKDDARVENEQIIKALESMIQLEPIGPRMVIGHGVIDGAKLDNNMIPRENGVIFPRTLLAKFKCPVRFGHYHMEQMLSENVMYLGSPSPVNIGERNTMKGVQVLTFEEDVVTYESITIPSPEIHTLESTWDDGEWFPDPLFNHPIEYYANSVVRFSYKASSEHVGAMNFQFLEDLNKVTLVPVIVVPDITIRITARAPEMREAMNPHVAVVVYWEHQQIPKDLQGKLIVLRDKIMEATL